MTSDTRALLPVLLSVTTVALGACSITDKNPGGVDDAATTDAAIDAPTDAPTAAALAFNQATYAIAPAPVMVDGATGTVMMTLQNTGGMPATGVQVMVTAGGPETSVNSNCPSTLMPQATCVATATLDPVGAGMKTATITATSAETAASSAMVTGTGAAIVAVTIATTGATTGTVTSTPAGIACTTGTCMFTFTSTPVSLAATDDGNGTMSDWGVAGCQVAGPCSLTLDGNKTLTAAFRAPLSFLDTDAADQGEGVAFDPTDGSILIGGSRGNDGLLIRLHGDTGVHQNTAAVTGSPTRHVLDISVASNRYLALAGEWTGPGGYDAVKSEINPAMVGGESALYPIGDTPTEQATAVCVDSTDRVYVAGTTGPGTNMFWGRWPAGSSTFAYLPNSPAAAKAGWAFDIAWGNSAVWIVGQSPAGGSGWLGKINETTGAITTELSPAGMTQAHGVTVYQTGVVVSGHNATQTIVRRYNAALAEVWNPPAIFTEVSSGSAVATDPTAAAAVYVATSGAGTSTPCTLRKLDGATGAVLWTRTVIADGSCFDLAANADGVVVAGYANVAGVRQVFAKKYFH